MTNEVIDACIAELRRKARETGKDDDATCLRLAVLMLVGEARGGANRFHLPDSEQ